LGGGYTPRVNQHLYSKNKHLDTNNDGFICLSSIQRHLLPTVDRIILKNKLEINFQKKRTLEEIHEIPKDQISSYMEVAKIEYLERAILTKSSLAYGLNSYPIILHPSEPNDRCFFIYHAGHGPQLDGAIGLVEQALKESCTVFLLEMPIWGPNVSRNRNSEEATLPSGELLDLTREDLGLHGAMEILEREYQENMLKLFIQPVIDTNNYIYDKHDDPKVVMAGLSGGGWTTHVAAAVDRRIYKSFAIAGSSPYESMMNEHDYEQNHELLNALGGYSSLYILAAGNTQDSAREHHHILNSKDNCCFNPTGKQWIEKNNWSEIINSLIRDRGLKGRYYLHIDESGDGHSIHIQTEDLIIAHLKNIE